MKVKKGTPMSEVGADFLDGASNNAFLAQVFSQYAEKKNLPRKQLRCARSLPTPRACSYLRI